MGQKVTEQVAEMRSLPAGIDQRSPARHPDWLGPGFLIGPDKDVILWGFTGGIVARLFQYVGWIEDVADAPVVEGSAGWYVFDDGRYVDLGELKGNIGSSNYLIPPDVDLGALPSVSIWCARFNVSVAATRLVTPQ